MTTQLACDAEPQTPTLRRVFVELDDDLTHGRLKPPSLPPLMGTLLAASPKLTPPFVDQMAGRDPALAEVLIRAARLAPFSGSTVGAAIRHLGVEAVRRLVMLYDLKRRIFRPGACANLAAAYWRHSVAAAFAADFVWRLLGRGTDDAFFIGLLHDIGRPVALGTIQDRLKHAGQTVRQEEIGRLVDGIHGQVGGIVANAWGLSPYVRCTILHHHDPAMHGQDTTGLSRLLTMADTLANAAGCTADESETSSHDMDRLSRAVGITHPHIDVILERLRTTAFEAMEI